MLYSPKYVPTQSLESRKPCRVGDNCGVHDCSWGYLIATGSDFEFEECHMNVARRSITNILYFEKIDVQKVKVKNRIHHNITIDNETDVLKELNLTPFNFDTTIHFFKMIHVLINPWKRSV